MADEYFFALTLKGKNAKEVWDPDSKGNGADEFQGGHKLIIKQALLGHEASPDDVNVIQVEAMTWKDSLKIPIAVLKAGGSNSQALLDISFPDPPVTFSLIQGQGPVHIVGHHLIATPMEEFDEIDEMEEDMLEDEEGDDGAEEETRKRKFKEEDEDEEEPKTKKTKAASNAKGKTPVKNNAKAKK